MLKSYPSLYNYGKAITSTSEGETTESTMHAIIHLLQNGGESQLTMRKKNQTVKSGCSGQRMPLLGSNPAVCTRCRRAGIHPLHPTFQFTSVRNLYGIFNTTERHILMLSQFFLGPRLSLNDCFCFVEFRRLILCY